MAKQSSKAAKNKAAMAMFGGHGKKPGKPSPKHKANQKERDVKIGRALIGRM